MQFLPIFALPAPLDFWPQIRHLQLHRMDVRTRNGSWP